MHRISLDPRPNWQRRVEECGLTFHTLGGEPYWDESAAYQLTRREVDQLELATQTLDEMCLELVQDVIDKELFGLFLIPKEFEELVVHSWEQDQPSLYGRFDLAFDGVGPPRMLEYNADTPTGLVEASVIQWFWLKDVDERGDQYNSIHERLLEGWRALRAYDPSFLHLAALADTPEDFVTVEYLRDTAIQAGFETQYLDVEQIAWDSVNHTFADTLGIPIRQIFKLYPWEWMIREEFGRHILQAPTRWIEPPWKMILSCKSILPLLYEKFPDCPYLLPASFGPLEGNYVRKPIHAREGSNIQVVLDGEVRSQTEGPYTEGPYVYQQLAPLRPHDGHYPIFGSWVIYGTACGVGIRESDNIITTNTSRFLPHQMIE